MIDQIRSDPEQVFYRIWFKSYLQIELQDSSNVKTAPLLMQNDFTLCSSFRFLTGFPSQSKIMILSDPDRVLSKSSPE